MCERNRDLNEHNLFEKVSSFWCDSDTSICEEVIRYLHRNTERLVKLVQVTGYYSTVTGSHCRNVSMFGCILTVLIPSDPCIMKWKRDWKTDSEKGRNPQGSVFSLSTHWLLQVPLPFAHVKNELFIIFLTLPLQLSDYVQAYTQTFLIVSRPEPPKGFANLSLFTIKEGIIVSFTMVLAVTWQPNQALRQVSVPKGKIGDIINLCLTEICILTSLFWTIAAECLLILSSSTWISDWSWMTDFDCSIFIRNPSDQLWLASLIIKRITLLFSTNRFFLNIKT